ncbi:unnamed protein product, partial [marine sediment metagenome]
YANLLYVFLTFPIGLTFFIYAWVCLPLLVGLSVFVVVLPILYIFLWTLPRLILIIGYLTELFVGLPVPIKDDIPKEIVGSFFTKALNAVKDKRIGKSLVYSMFLALPYGTFVFSIMTFLLSLSGALIAMPIVFAIQYTQSILPVDWIDWLIAHVPLGGIIPIMIVAFFLGIGLFPVVLQISNKLAIFHARMVQKALVR